MKALVLNQVEGKTVASIETLESTQLPEGDVRVSVEYSSLNYKDGLAIKGLNKIVQQFPMVPGIDFAGEVVESKSEAYKPGDKVVLTGWGVGERHWGGYAQEARVPEDWLVPLPENMSSLQAMEIGTAGLTAMLSVMALEHAGVMPGGKPVVVSGASGGVGSIAIALLTHLGYEVAAITGRESSHEYLSSLGANMMLSRHEMATDARPLEKVYWAGGIDTVGDKVLAKMLAQTEPFGSVAACGLVGGVGLPTTVMPFILRGVNLLGIDSVMCPAPRRAAAWQRLASDLPATFLDNISQIVSLENMVDLADQILQGQTRGRIVVDPNL
ncbi:MAG: oxidoreductase [Gammaproteobacteria bacterium]|nr:oxidoreductase [Gammaproteobacteria bacterium]